MTTRHQVRLGLPYFLIRERDWESFLSVSIQRAWPALDVVAEGNVGSKVLDSGFIFGVGSCSRFKNVSDVFYLKSHQLHALSSG